LRHLQADLERQVQQRTEALRQNEQRWRKMAESLPQLVWTASPSGQCDYFSSQWTAFTGATPAELLGNRWLEYLHPDDRDRTLAAWQTAVKERGELDLEYRLRRSDGAYRWFKVRGLPIRDGDGPVLQWFGTSTDIDDQKRTEGALREADRRKDEFLATLAHELRNPLAPIRNALGILHLAPADGSAVRQARALIERQVAQMVRLVDDLLDVSRITRGKIELRKERVELADIVKAAVETSRPLIEAAGHQLRVVLPGEAIHLHADPTRLAQVLANLLNNSAKYMLPGGSILLSGAREGQWAIVRAKDTGIGIPPEMLDSIFDLFTQVDHSLERSQGGLGIGLTLVRSLVHLHGGTVEAVSEGRGRGSEFVVRLPAPTLATEVAPPLTGASEAPPPLAGRRVLLADDNRDGAESLAMLLRLTGHDVRVTFDGETAIAAARVFQPEVILLDIGMPKLNGYEVARRLRQGTDSAPVHLVAMTGWGQEEDRRRSREAGFDHHLVKPVDPAALQELLRTLAPASNGIAPASAADFFA
jgi:two-component system CheB/CheR fusion protein